MTVLENTPSAVLVLAVGVLCGTGVYLLLERPLTRVLLGFVLIGNGVNLMLLVAGGRAGASPIVGNAPNDEPMSDPLAQAMILTSIVITLALTALVLAVAYRSWQLHGHDEVADDVEDRRVARQAALNAPAFEDADATETGETLDEEAAEVYDEVADDDPDGQTPGDAPTDTPGGAR
ncbi:Na(+)/H(+) antiporter subunit C [Isoptericola sp. BMS4]|uniref:Na(+)/H(+) antiporter subunit C n=1 Tax=Isoptericola sp. BMS4 TaxID=2527875 RepID=UPI00141EEB0A|nr:Na(+)/H(+) antiporter subunit C [Isoptericola sp. BMS4]